MMKSRVGTPASASVRMAPNRRSGRGARGSSRRASAGSGVVIERFTVTSDAPTIARRSSTSRVTRVDFVVIDRRRPGTSRAASRIRRVTSKRPSAG
jgi:hypothetical protein